MGVFPRSNVHLSSMSNAEVAERLPSSSDVEDTRALFALRKRVDDRRLTRQRPRGLASLGFCHWMLCPVRAGITRVLRKHQGWSAGYAIGAWKTRGALGFWQAQKG